MSDWFNDDNNNTENSNDSFGFFGSEAEESTDNALETDNAYESEQPDTKTGFISRIKNKLGSKQFTLLIISIVGLSIIIAVALIFGNDVGQKPTKQTENKVTQQPQPTQKPIQSSSYSDWTDMTGAAFDTGSEKTAIFTVTDYKMYARNTGGKVAPLEIRVELWGALAGYDGVYKVDVPYDTISVIQQLNTQQGDPLSFQVKYKVGTYNGSKIIYDITP